MIGPMGPMKDGGRGAGRIDVPPISGGSVAGSRKISSNSRLSLSISLYIVSQPFSLSYKRGPLARGFDPQRTHAHTHLERSDPRDEN